MLVLVEDYDKSSTKQWVDRVTKTKRITITHLALCLSPASNVVSLSLVYFFYFFSTIFHGLMTWQAF